MKEKVINVLSVKWVKYLLILIIVSVIYYFLFSGLSLLSMIMLLIEFVFLGIGIFIAVLLSLNILGIRQQMNEGENKGFVLFIVVAFVIAGFFESFVVRTSHKWENSLMDYGAEFKYDNQNKSGTVQLFSSKAYPAEASYSQDLVKEIRAFFKPRKEEINVIYIKGPCGTISIRNSNLNRILGEAKDDEMGVIAFYTGIYDFIDNCKF
jgi:hypothetical protein